MKPQYQSYIKQLIKACGEQGYWMRNLGLVGDKPIWFIQNGKGESKSGPSLLIVAGFHGEEKAGPWSVLDWIKLGRETRARLSFIPLVNPTAFNLGKRYNTWGEFSNAGFIHKGKPSEEGKILLENKDLIVPAAKDGLLSLHEDVDSTGYYVYTFERSKEPGKFTCGLLDALGKHFDRAINGHTVNTDADNPGPYIVNGVVYRHCDGSFEDWLFHEGSKCTAVTETPANHIRLQRRVKANIDVIDKFIKLCMED